MWYTIRYYIAGIESSICTGYIKELPNDCYILLSFYYVTDNYKYDNI